LQVFVPTAFTPNVSHDKTATVQLLS